MGYYKQEYTAFTEQGCIHEEGTPAFTFAFEMFCAMDSPEAEEPVGECLERQFIQELFPDLEGTDRIWAMASRDGCVYNFSFTDIERMLSVMKCMSVANANLFFSPAVFKGKRKDKNVSRVNAIYVDIDGITDINLSSIDQKTLKRYLIDKYNLKTAEMIPNWVVVSGHGLHLYYIVDTLNLKDEYDSMTREQYTNYLIVHFGADTACRNKSRVLRYPGSHNVKDADDIRTVRLFHLNKSKDHKIGRLFWFAHTREEVTAYEDECRARRAARRKATMLANGTWKGKKQPKEPKQTKDTTQKTKAEKAAHTRRKAEQDDDCSRSHPELRCISSPLPSNARYRKVIRDLHNWAARRAGVPKGYRAIFTHILAVFLKRMGTPEEETVATVAGYVDEGFFNEATEIIRCVYENATEYMYSCLRIAQLLDFTDYDIEHSICSYTDEQRRSARKRSGAAYDAKRYGEQRQKAASAKKERYRYIKEHPEQTIKELAQRFGCSVRTIEYIRAEIRDE